MPRLTRQPPTAATQLARRRSLVAAARAIPAVKVNGTIISKPPDSKAMQDEAWTFFEDIPEIRQGLRYKSNIIAKVRLFPAVANPDPNGDPIPVTDARSGVPADVAAVAVTELARLKSLRGGQAEIKRQMILQAEVAGEGWIVGRAPHTETVLQLDGTKEVVDVAESWEVHSVSEVIPGDKGWRVTPSGERSAGYDLTAEDTLIRFWVRHPRFSERPESVVHGLKVDARPLLVLQQLVLADSNSKRPNGFLLVPNEIDFAASPNQTDDDEDDPDEDAFLTELAEMMQGPIADPEHPASVQPALVRGPAEFLKEVRHLVLDRKAGDLDAKIEARVKRLARGMNLPVEVVLGLESTTFANADQIDRDEFDDYMQPSTEWMCDAITYGFLGPQLADNTSATVREWADRIFVWYDATPLFTKPRPEDSADAGYKEGAISGAAWRRVKGYDDSDAPSDVELLHRAGLQRGALQGDLVVALLQLLGVNLGVASGGNSNAAPAPAAPAASALALPAVVASGRARAVSPIGRQLREMDTNLRARLTVAADAAMTRALDKAGARLRTKASKVGVDARTTLRTVDNRHVAATLGRALVAAAHIDPLEGAWDELEVQFREWSAAAQTQALDLAARVTAGFTTDQRAALQLRQAGDIDTAWAWMKDSLTSLAEARMFDPTGTLDTIGEFDPASMVPTGLVRQALARAGGATGLVTSGDGSAWLVLYPDGTPPGGIATGEVVLGAIRDGGAEVDGFVWVYGPGVRNSFPPHAELDGVTFTNFDDPVLSNDSGWPETAFYCPGDHRGCQCDYEPTIIPAEGSLEAAA